MSDELSGLDPAADRGLYILDDQRRPVHVKDIRAWAEWFEINDDLRLVKREHIGPFFISTRFSGIDLSILNCFLPETTPPLLFETMAFRMFPGPGDKRKILAQERCSTWEQAEAQHARIASVYRKLNDQTVSN